MIPIQRDPDVFAASTMVADAMMDARAGDLVQRSCDAGLRCAEPEHHRQAAQHRSVRLRTIEQLRRPGKSA